MQAIGHKAIFIRCFFASVILLTSALPSSSFAWSSRYNVYVSLLRNIPIDYGTYGAICEQVARLELGRRYYNSRTYEIRTGLMYGSRNVVQGELDIVVFEKRSRKAVMVAEVKCSSNLDRAKSAAKKQRSRFIDAINHQNVDVWDPRTEEAFSIDQFVDVEEFWIIAQRGSKAWGFDYDLMIDLSEAGDLRMAMIECQNAGRCVTPKRSNELRRMSRLFEEEEKEESEP